MDYEPLIILEMPAQGSIVFHKGSDCCCLVEVPYGLTVEGFLNSRGWEHQDTLDELGNNQYICLVSDLFEF